MPGAPGSRSRAKSKEEDSMSTSNFDTINSKLDLLIGEVSKTNNRLEDLEKSVEYLHSEYRDMGTKTKALQTQVDSLAETLDSLKTLENRIEMYEHMDRAKLIELNGIPFAKNEDLFEGLEMILKKSKIPDIDLSRDIDKVYRVKQSKRIVVKFLTTSKRETFFKHYRKNIPDISKLGFKGDSKIFINEILSTSQSKLYWQTRKFKTEHNFKFVWTFRQKIYLRKTVESDAIEIYKESDLDDLLTAC